MAKKTFDVAVLGGGPGGYAAAFRAADLGLNVALIDELENPGGVCLYWGCVPTKALLHIVKVMDDAAHAADFGVTYGKPDVDLDGVRAFKDRVVSSLTKGLGGLVKKRKITYYRGRGRFADKNTIEVADGEGNTEPVAFKNAIISTGAKSARLPGIDIDSGKVWVAKSALDLEHVPSSLLVVGGGYIGLELGTVFSRLGSKVTVCEMTSGIMPGADRDLVDVFLKANKSTFSSIRTETVVSDMQDEKNGVRVTFTSATDADSRGRAGDSGTGDSVTEEGDPEVFERVLLTVGNVPNTQDIGLEEIGVVTDKKGFVTVDEARRTSVPSIYAAGDVTGAPLLAHKAKLEGHVAAENCAGEEVVYDPATIPAVEYTVPEIAWCGLTEQQAKEKGIAVTVGAFPWAASGRALSMGAKIGKTKVIADAETNRVLGVGVVGRDAGELIPEATFAIEMAALADDLALTVHPHPTLSETIMEAAADVKGLATDIYNPRKLP